MSSGDLTSNWTSTDLTDMWSTARIPNNLHSNTVKHLVHSAGYVFSVPNRCFICVISREKYSIYGMYQ